MKRTAAVLALIVLGFTAAAAVGHADRRCHHRVCGTTTAPSTTTAPTTTSPSPYLFDDEFNGAAGSKPSSTLWTAKSYTDNGSGTVWNGWNQVSENGSGDLVITAAKNSSGVWQSALIAGTTNYSGARYVETRAEVPCGAGTWAAPLWETGNGAPQFENDVIEQLGKEPQSYHATLHNWTAPGVSTSSGHAIATGANLCSGFHTYGAAVYADHVDFYFDGAEVASTLASSIGLSDLTTWSDHVMVDLAMGGTWAGTPTISGPASLLVDYVRVAPVSAAPPPTTTTTTTTTTSTTTPTTTTTPPPSYLFDDEFTGPAGSAPDSSKWKVYGGAMPSRWGNECFVNDRSHIALDGQGHLVETATYNPGGTPCTNGAGPYESGGMDTGNFPAPLFSFQYGDVEARIKVPCQSGYGMWPAWWMTGPNWPNGGEADLLEVMATTGHGGYDAAQHLHGAKSAGGVWSLAQHNVSTQLYCNAFHVYGAQWSPGSFSFTLDGTVTGTFTPASMQSGWTWPFDTNPENLFLDLQTGGAGGTVDNSTLPQSMLIDWVRVTAS